MDSLTRALNVHFSSRLKHITLQNVEKPKAGRIFMQITHCGIPYHYTGYIDLYPVNDFICCNYFIRKIKQGCESCKYEAGTDEQVLKPLTP